MPCGSSKKEMESADPTLTVATQDGQLGSFINLIQPTNVPALIENGHGDDILTTYLNDPEDAESGAGGHYTQPTITVTQEVTQEITVTVTMTPSTLATLQNFGAEVQTATTNSTAAPVDSLCVSTGAAIGVPIACALGTGALMFGAFCLYLQKRTISNKRRLEAAVAAILAHADHSTDGRSAPIPISRRCDHHRSGIEAPPSSLETSPSVPQPDLDAGLGGALDNQADNDQDIEAQKRNFISGYGTIPQAGANIDNEGRFDSRTNGSVCGQSSNATALTNNFGRGGSASSALLSDEVHPTVVYAPPANEGGGARPVIQAALTAPIRAIEIPGHGCASQRASIVDVSEERESNFRASSIVPVNQERGDIAELEGSLVPARFSATSKGKSVERASNSSDDSQARTLGRDSSVEFSGDDEIHELDSEGALAPPNSEQSDNNEEAGDKADQ